MYKANFERKRDYIIPGRIDLQVEILPVLFEKLFGMADGEAISCRNLDRSSWGTTLG